MIEQYFVWLQGLSPVAKAMLLYLEAVALVLLLYQWTLERRRDPINEGPIPAMPLPLVAPDDVYPKWAYEDDGPQRSRRSEVSRSLTSDRSEVGDGDS